jgi:hypothetical protein
MSFKGQLVFDGRWRPHDIVRLCFVLRAHDWEVGLFQEEDAGNEDKAEEEEEDMY